MNIEKITLKYGTLPWAVQMLLLGYPVSLLGSETWPRLFFLSYYENGKLSDLLENDATLFAFTGFFFECKATGWKIYKKSASKYDVSSEKDVEVLAGSLPWVFQMLLESKKLTHESIVSYNKSFSFSVVGNKILDDQKKEISFCGFDFWFYKDGWQVAI